MPLNWLSVLKIIPWADVISTAPKVADGARKLWKTVAERRARDETPADQAPPDAEAFGVLSARVSTLEATTDELHNQMLASSELIKSLAEQNEQLIARLESQRRTQRWVLVAVLLASAIAIGALLRTLA